MKASLKLVRECTTRTELMKAVGKLCRFYDGEKCCKNIGKLTLHVDSPEKVLEVKVDEGSVLTTDYSNHWVKTAVYKITKKKEQKPIICYVHSIEKVLSVTIEERDALDGMMTNSICIELETTDDQNNKENNKEDEWINTPVIKKHQYVNEYNADASENVVESMSPRTLKEVLKQCSPPKLERGANIKDNLLLQYYPKRKQVMCDNGLT